MHDVIWFYIVSMNHESLNKTQQKIHFYLQYDFVSEHIRVEHTKLIYQVLTSS